MSDQEFEIVIGFCLLTCVLIIVIWLFIKCVSCMLGEPQGPQECPTRPNCAMKSISRRNKQLIAINTEWVGAGFKGTVSMIARVSLVTKDGKILYDEFVKPKLPVTDYRTLVSGIRRKDLEDAKDFQNVRQEVAYLLKSCILIGHDVKNDLDRLDLIHPTEDIRDTATYQPFRDIYLVNHDVFTNVMKRNWSKAHRQPERSGIIKGDLLLYPVDASDLEKAFSKVNKCVPKNQKLSLKWLAKHLLKRNIQDGEHNSVEDARAAMDLYLDFEKGWEGV